MTLSTSFEKKHLNGALEKLTYQEFMGQLNQFFKSGKFIWFFSGNIQHEVVISTVEKVRGKFNMKNVEIADLVEVRPIAIEAG